MNYYTFLQRPRLIILGLLLLLALLLLLRVPALSLTAPAIQGAATANEAVVDATTVDLAPRIHAADLKFYGDGYASGGSARLDAYSVETVHPADRKFLYAAAANAAVIDAATVDLAPRIHAADRKFYGNGYASGGSAPLDAYSVEAVHPADRKFLYAAADRVGAGTEIHPADRKFITGGYGYRNGD